MLTLKLTLIFRLCGNERSIAFIEDIAHCSDVVFHFPPSQDMPWLFLSHFLIHRPERYDINFSCFKISDWKTATKETSTPNPFNFSHACFRDRYSLQMLTSLGYVFRDKWAQLTDEKLNWSAWKADERYPLCCFAVEQLIKDHGYDLTRTSKDYNAWKKKAKISGTGTDKDNIDIDNTQRLKIACCTLTPLKIIFQPLQSTTGSRALRHPA